MNFIPKKEFLNRPADKPWMNNEIRKQIRKRNRLYHKAKHTSNENHFQNYRNKRNEVIDLIRDAKKQYLHKLQSSLNNPNLPPKQWHKIANEITKLKNKNNPPPPLYNDGQVNLHPFDKAETLNNHFAKISTTENEPVLPDDDPETDFSLNFIEINQQDVKDQIHKLNTTKPGGPDEIMPRLIKIAGKSLIQPLTMLYNKSIVLGEVPCQWKMANISAIFKGKGDDQDPANYRPHLCN